MHAGSCTQQTPVRLSCKSCTELQLRWSLKPSLGQAHPLSKGDDVEQGCLGDGGVLLQRWLISWVGWLDQESRAIEAHQASTVRKQPGLDRPKAQAHSKAMTSSRAAWGMQEVLLQRLLFLKVIEGHVSINEATCPTRL